MKNNTINLIAQWAEVSIVTMVSRRNPGIFFFIFLHFKNIEIYRIIDIVLTYQARQLGLIFVSIAPALLEPAEIYLRIVGGACF